MADRINWLTHSFSINDPGASWKEVAGVYIFAGINQANQWVPLYIGQASSLAARLATHERWSEAKRLGATHIHARAVAKQSDRDAIERALIEAFQPHLNSQLK
jgi:excinuclease UvrABC nuclease subunit